MSSDSDNPVNDPLENRGNGDGRDPSSGRFRPGCKPGPGRPANTSPAGLARQRFEEVTGPEDIDLAVGVLREAMNEGGKMIDRLRAAELMLSRMLGPVVALDILQRIEALEAAIAERKGANGY